LVINTNNEIRLLEQLECSWNVLIESSDAPTTLEETERRQNMNHSLTNITDGTFQFF
jgi:hypothetical protein